MKKLPHHQILTTQPILVTFKKSVYSPLMLSSGFFYATYIDGYNYYHTKHITAN